MNHKELTPEEHHVMREKGTEAPFSGAYLNTKDKGTYICKACGHVLFSSDTKYDSNSGWPSFYEALSEGSVKLQTDNSLGMERTEVVCSNCDAHLGHVFDDGPTDKGGKRYCINSVCLDLQKDKYED